MFGLSKRFASLKSPLLGALVSFALGATAFAPAPRLEISSARAPEASLHRELVTLAVLSDSAFHPKSASRTIHPDLFGALPAGSPRLSTGGARKLETLPGIALGPIPSFTPNARAPPRAG